MKNFVFIEKKRNYILQILILLLGMICFEVVFSRLWHIEVVSMGMIGPIRGPN